MITKDWKKLILKMMLELLSSNGFKLRSFTFLKNSGDLTFFINIQSSKWSTSEKLIVTVNVIINSLTLFNVRNYSMKFEENQHYHRRIGEYLDNAHDKWWTIENTEQASTAAKEICSIMEERILVELSKFNSTQDLINAWLNKKYFGITEFQRKEYLALLGVMDMPNYKSL